MKSFFGRARETAALDALLDRVTERGDALALRGEPGIGKSALLIEASRRAKDRGMQVLTTTGVQSETHLPFAGLHQLLRPILVHAGELPAPQRDAVHAAFGMTEAEPPELFLIALATLDLLGETAAGTPLLLVVEDAQWLDHCSADVLAFVARRVESDPIILVTASREGSETSLDGAGLTELRLEGLDDVAAAALLDAHAPGLAPALRERLLDEAAGNPLALVELPIASGDLPDGALLPEWLPLTTRLEAAFATRVTGLPAGTRTLLLVAALNDSEALTEVLDAAARLVADELTLRELAPALTARLIDVDEVRLRFRHPLVRSAIHQVASLSQRHAAHAALAAVITDQPDRRIWHRAASSVGPDEEVAAGLEGAATRSQRRGALIPAVAALERAAQLSDDPARRGRRLLVAAELALELGRREVVVRLLREAEPLELSQLDRGRLAWLRETFEPSIPGDPATVRSMVDIADRVSTEGDPDLALNLLWAAASSAFWADRGPDTRDQLLAAAERMPVSDGDPRLLSIFAYAAPIERGAVVIERASRWAADRSVDPVALQLLGNAVSTVGGHDLSEGFLTASVDRLREQGRLVVLAQVLVLRAWSGIHLGRWNLAIADAEEARRLASETAQPIWETGAEVAQAMLAGMRGDEDAAAELTAEAEEVGLLLGARAVLAVVQIARGLTALGAGRYTDAYAQLRRMFDPADPAHHHMQSCWAIGDLAEAAVRSGHRDEARMLMAQLEPVAQQTPSPWLHVAMRHARALVADDEDAEALFEAGLQAHGWPFDRARLQLAYGAWLRRQRRAADSRAPLRAARDAFDALGAIPWSERARQELRASGETSRRRTPDVRDQLTPQELQIAQMAAEGLSNREIGQKLYLSHRTVGSHLYRTFPKLGITSRSELPATLDVGIPTPA